MRHKRRPPAGKNAPPKKTQVFPTSKCKLRLLKLERIKDYLLMEQEFIQNQEVFKPHEEKDKEERDKMEEIRGSPLAVGSLEEMIDDTHAIISSSVGPEYYVSVMSFVNQDLRGRPRREKSRPRRGIFRGDGSRRRRGRDGDISWRRVVGRDVDKSAERGDAAATTWTVRGARRGRGRDGDISWRRVVGREPEPPERVGAGSSRAARSCCTTRSWPSSASCPTTRTPWCR